jgi:hypothetical protein
MKQRRRIYYSAAQRSEIWDRWQAAGGPMSSIGRRFDRESSSVFSVISPTGGIRPPDRRRAPGSAGQTKTPTDCCANIFRVAPICPYIAKPNSARSQGSSMKGPERPCSIKPQQTSSRNVLPRPVEPAANSCHSNLAADSHCRVAPVAPDVFQAFGDCVFWSR